MALNDIREKYLAFFETKGHLRLPSFSLVPENDKSLLIINSGMAPMKPYFAGTATPPRKRVTTCQKCVRTGDIENVGKSGRHVSFFEMLGNFSFGDYFKKEAIPWAWEFMTEVLKFQPERLFISVYLDDDEAANIWKDDVGVDPARIVRMGRPDNFWEHGLGPCGPCSEIYFDRGSQYGQDDFLASVTADEDRYIEVWNLVFTQFSKEEDGSYSNLANPNIDTGMGLDRMALVMQGVDSIFEIDTIKSIRDTVCTIAGADYGKNPANDLSIRIVTDHIRPIVFMTADGILPSNEGRGYVLRRLLRRAVRHGRSLGISDLFLSRLAKTVIAQSGGAYPEIKEKSDYIFKLVDTEESRFHETLDAGMEILRNLISGLEASKTPTLPGFEAFKLYDTYGFPVELTQEILAEHGFGLDEDGFSQEMEKQRTRGRQAREESTFLGADTTVYDGLTTPPTEFFGHTANELKSCKIQHLIVKGEMADSAAEGDEVVVIVNKTPIYAEGGGQAGDGGIIKTSSGTVVVRDCLKVSGGFFAHMGIVSQGAVSTEDKCEIFVDTDKRAASARHHTATHLLQAALRAVLGSHVQQSGSLVTPDRLRFDFTHFSPLSPENITDIENMVNSFIFAAAPVSAAEMNIDEARNVGALALFGERYGEVVRVVSIGDESRELCGGIHVDNTAKIGLFKLISENGIAAGVRRIEALCGPLAIAHFQNMENTLNTACAHLKTKPDALISRIEQLQAATREAERELARIRAKDAGSAIDDILAKREQIAGCELVCGELAGVDINDLRNLGDRLLAKITKGIAILISTTDNRANIIAMAAPDAVSAGVHCGNIIKAAANAAGGGGGGRPNMAQAGIPAEKSQTALTTAKEALKSML